nr:energy transducer TonB [Sphingomonas tagetis]
MPDRGSGAPVRPGGGNGIAALVFVAVLVIGGALAYIFTQSESRWYGSPIDADVPEREPRPTAETGQSGKLRPAGSPQNWVTDDDYPPEALRQGWQGTVGFTLEVGPNGRPHACHVTTSSGTKLLDDAACALLMKRARFVPARDGTGNAVSAKFSSRFTWRIP